MKSSHSTPHSNSKKRRPIVEAMLREVPFDGWTEAAFGRAIRAAGVTQGEAGILFPRGIPDVIEEFGIMADEAMQARIAKTRGFGKLRVREKIAFAVRARLEFLTPHREAVRRLMAWYALPFHWPQAARRLYRTVDEAWHAAGDTSTDFNFYTKRGLLAGVLKATILFWLDDETLGCEASWEFLDRRIDEVLKVGQFIGKLRDRGKAA
jgi:ubiquinone biosynthesis protein COQ9